MAFYHKLAYLTFVIFIGVSIFYFMEDQDNEAILWLFFAVYCFVGVFYLLKSLYYLRHRATFNELLFVVGLPIIPLIFVSFGQYSGVNDLYFSDLISARWIINTETIELGLTFASILSLPYFFFSIYLLLRTFIRYEFIRWNAHSDGGPPGTLVGLILAIGVGISYLFLALLFSDLLIGFFGFIYALNGILGFLA